jgi:general secretion pathway protein G
MKRTKQSGFTLVEVLTVIAIIALLAALILGLAGNAQKTAARHKAEAEITQWESVLTQYQMKYGQVPKTLAAVTNEDFCTITNLTDPWGMPYEYTNSSQATFYLWSMGGSMDSNRSMYIGNPTP